MPDIIYIPACTRSVRVSRHHFYMFRHMNHRFNFRLLRKVSLVWISRTYKLCTYALYTDRNNWGKMKRQKIIIRWNEYFILKFQWEFRRCLQAVTTPWGRERKYRLGWYQVDLHSLPSPPPGPDQ